MDLDWTDRPHRRFNPLLGEWILVSPQRATRPWLGAVEKVETKKPTPYDPECYLCPGNARAGGVRNPVYESTFVFDNDFPALLPGAALGRLDRSGLLAAEAESGVCRVACFSPRHDLTISGMEVAELNAVVEMWCGQYAQFCDMPLVNHVQIFENRGEAMGASNPHPHCQIWAGSSVPTQAGKETASQLEYDRAKASCLLCDYAVVEKDSERMVCANESFIAAVPFWATWPFEIIVISRRHMTGMDQLEDGEKAGLGGILSQITRCYDKLFGAPFPYSMGFHQRPVDGKPHGTWHLHAHFFPPLLRSATIKKFMVGYELLAEAQRDLTPEIAAGRLRAISSETQ
ncbi:MAG: UDP-glucose--hexose-1-phosphate uridylyltransferase [Acidobacteriota bacterium]|nr:UDP-glucose--hexose-1-phosphate uridylyltransferase [Acidobacteriota bacterium]